MRRMHHSLIAACGGTDPTSDKKKFDHESSECGLLSKTLVIESIYLRDLSAFVIASQYGDAIWVTNFQGNQKLQETEPVFRSRCLKLFPEPHEILGHS